MFVEVEAKVHKLNVCFASMGCVFFFSFALFLYSTRANLLKLCNEEAWGAECKGHPKVLEDNFE
jgi:hypothetical protein